jgi:hypothetical protein
MKMRLRHIAGHTVALASAFALTACSTTSHTEGIAPSSLPYSLVINNRSDLEVVVYAISSPGAPGIRLGSARSFGTSILAVPANVLQASNDFVVQLHAIGQATHQYDWVSPRVTLAEDVVAKLDIHSNGRGDLGMSSFYTESAAYAIPLAMRKGH